MTDAGAVGRWANGKWMLRNGGVPTLMVALQVYSDFARAHDAEDRKREDLLRRLAKAAQDFADDGNDEQLRELHAALAAVQEVG